MSQEGVENFIIGRSDRVLVTGSAGFIGRKVVERLLSRGWSNIRCFARPSAEESRIAALRDLDGPEKLQIYRGNLLSEDDCRAATKDVELVIHLAAGRGEKSYPAAFSNSVVTTRNLLEACASNGGIKRFVNVSSFTVYTNRNRTRGRILDETCPVEQHPHFRGEAYCYAKVRQDELVVEYGEKHHIPYVLVRPGSVYGTENPAIPGRVGVDTFGIFLHLGGSNTIPFTYVDNCADAIVLAGLVQGIDNQVFNVVDDELPSSRRFLREYKRNVGQFGSLYVPKAASYLLCSLWEKYSAWSENQLPPAFNRSRWFADWRKATYSNEKLKSLTGWKPIVSTREGMRRYFEACRRGVPHA